MVARLEEARGLSRVRPGYRRLVHYVESSPEDQLQPKHSTLLYAKPGDVARPRAAGALRRRSRSADRDRSTTLFPNALRRCRALVWRKDSRALHLRVQPARPPGLSRHRGRRRDRHARARSSPRSRRRSSTTTGQRHARRLGQAVSATTSTTARRSSGCRSATAGIISICTTARPARVKNQITKGEWVVRGVEQVDDDEAPDLVQRQRHVRRARIRTSLHYYRINFDGTGLTPLTDGRRQSHRRRSRPTCSTTSTPTRASISPPVVGAARAPATARW